MLHKLLRSLTAAAGLLLALSPRAFADPALTAKIDSYLQPYIDSNQFSGSILVTQDGNIVFDKAYGFADAGAHVPNQPTTSFHLGTLSAQYTAVAVMMLIDAGRLSPANTVAQFVPGVDGGDRITVRDLLRRDPATDPAAYRTLARIIEASAGKPLADVLDADFFGPLFMNGSGLDDGAMTPERRMAKGYTLAGGGPKPAAPVAWADRTGSASAYATTRDEVRWLDALFGDRLATAASRQALLTGAGWSQADATRFGETAYAMAGAAPGFSAAIIRLPTHDVTVIVLGNIDSAAPERIGRDLAALALGRAASP
jgi:CubicO group peptidase (beta-lactamase class C family)